MGLVSRAADCGDPDWATGCESGKHEKGAGGVRGLRVLLQSRRIGTAARY